MLTTARATFCHASMDVRVRRKRFAKTSFSAPAHALHPSLRPVAGEPDRRIRKASSSNRSQRKNEFEAARMHLRYLFPQKTLSAALKTPTRYSQNAGWCLGKLHEGGSDLKAGTSLLHVLRKRRSAGCVARGTADSEKKWK